MVLKVAVLTQMRVLPSCTENQVGAGLIYGRQPLLALAHLHNSCRASPRLAARSRGASGLHDGGNAMYLVVGSSACLVPSRGRPRRLWRDQDKGHRLAQA